MTVMLRPVFTTFLAIFALLAEAQEVRDCAGLEPVAVMRAPDLTFGEGAVRLWRVETETGVTLAVFFPGANAAGPAICRVVGLGEDEGFLDIDIAEVDARYDAETGLALEFAVVVDDSGEPLVDMGMLRVVIDRAQGRVMAETWGG